MTKLIKFSSVDILMKTLSSHVSNDLREALKINKMVSLSVPGGTTPSPFFDCLCNEDLEWQRVNILLSDERYLPENNIRSNTGLILKHLIQKKASLAKVVSFYDKTLSEEEFVNKNEPQMSALLPINVSILGMGEDMHTASLFPDSNELNDALKSDKTLHVVRPKSQPEARISLSGKALSSAKKTYVLILGEDKLNAYKMACSENSVKKAPIRVVFGSNTQVFWSNKV